MSLRTLALHPGNFVILPIFLLKLIYTTQYLPIRSIEIPNHNLNNNRLFLGGSMMLYKLVRAELGLLLKQISLLPVLLL